MSATAGIDYCSEQNKSITVEPGQNTAVIIEIQDDREVEPDEIFLVNISGAAVGDGISNMEITIRDDDGELIPTLIYVKGCTLDDVTTNPALT